MKFKYLVLLVFLSILLVRCAAPATIEGMTVTDYKSPKQIGNKIFIKPMTGGEETIWYSGSKISNENFEEAFKKSILGANVFSKISTVVDDDWVLEINLIKLDQPVIGFSFTVTSTVEYKLYYKNELVLTKKIEKPGIATIADATVGLKRLRLANEVSAKNNIKALLESLNEIALDSTASASVPLVPAQ